MKILKLPIIALSLSLAAFTPAVHAESATTVTQALEKINISARQRMLAQRMAGLSCLVHLGIEPEIHGAEALEAEALFGETLATLSDSGTLTGLSGEQKSKIMEAVDRVTLPFSSVSGYLTVLSTNGEMGTNRLAFIAASANELFEASDLLTNRVQASESHNIQSLSLIQTMILNFSGRQRMLSEKAFKEFCLAQAGIESEQNLQELANTVHIFDNTMSALVNGMPGLIIAPPTAAIRAKLEETNAVWQPVKEILDRAVLGKDFDSHDIHYVTEELETVRMLMDDAVTLYEHYNETTS